MDIDEFLSLPTPGFELLATVEASAEEQDKVLLTPWNDESGCACSERILIPKGAIANVEPTDKRHHCCGKVAVVVKITLKADAALHAADVLPNIVARGRTASPNWSDASEDCMIACSEEAADCLANCGGPGCKMGCTRRYRACIKRCRG